MPVFKESDADEYLHWATIMSSLAQEESCSISENITWGQRRSFAKGKVHMPYKLFLGYEKGEDLSLIHISFWTASGRDGAP